MLTEKIKKLLKKNGARLVGIGDMRNIENCAYTQKYINSECKIRLTL